MPANKALAVAKNVAVAQEVYAAAEKERLDRIGGCGSKPEYRGAVALIVLISCFFQLSVALAKKLIGPG